MDSAVHAVILLLLLDVKRSYTRIRTILLLMLSAALPISIWDWYSMRVIAFPPNSCSCHRLAAGEGLYTDKHCPAQRRIVAGRSC
jgi:hypothetical protein